MTDKSKIIAEQNDSFRKKLTMLLSLCNDTGINGKYFITDGVSSLTIQMQKTIFDSVCDFNKFNEGNDPHGEHDFGAFTVKGQKIFWKIDYYDTNYEYGSEDPSDLTITRRVLTVMLASEY